MRRGAWLLVLAVLLGAGALGIALLREGAAPHPAAVVPAPPGAPASAPPAETPSPAGATARPTAATPAPATAREVTTGDAALERARSVLQAIEARRGEPLPGYVGGRTFQNRERRLPAGAYREYDVHPKVAGRDRGPERLVVEQQTGKAYFTADHYRTFVPLR